MTGPAYRQKQKLRKQAHAAFDLIWLEGYKSRNKAYAWLAFRLGVDRRQCHFGVMDIETLERSIDACREFLSHHAHRVNWRIAA